MILTALGAGLAGALIASFVRTPAPDAGQRPAGPAADANDSELLARLERLEQDQHQLLERLEMETPDAGPRRTALDPAGDWVTRAELDGLLGALEARMAQIDRSTAPALEFDGTRETFDARVATALATIRKQEKVDGLRDYQRKRAERIDEDMARIDSWLGLAQPQSAALRTALLAQYEREDEQRRLWEEGADPEYVGELKRADRELFRAEAERALDPEQYQTFWNRAGAGGK